MNKASKKARLDMLDVAVIAVRVGLRKIKRLEAHNQALQARNTELVLENRRLRENGKALEAANRYPEQI